MKQITRGRRVRPHVGRLRRHGHDGIPLPPSPSPSSSSGETESAVSCSTPPAPVPLGLFSHEFYATVWSTARVTVDQLGPDRVIAMHKNRASDHFQTCSVAPARRHFELNRHSRRLSFGSFDNWSARSWPRRSTTVARTGRRGVPPTPP